MMQGTQVDLLGAVGKNAQVAAKCIIVSMAPGVVVLVLSLGSTAIQSVKSRSNAYSRRHWPAGRLDDSGGFLKCVKELVAFSEVHSPLSCGRDRPPRMVAEPQKKLCGRLVCIALLFVFTEDFATHA
jgi:hypothetical protein